MCVEGVGEVIAEVIEVVLARAVVVVIVVVVGGRCEVRSTCSGSISSSSQPRH